MPEHTVIAVPRESAPGETRVALTPDTVRRLVSDDVQVRVEGGAGLRASFSDEAYREAGALVVDGPEGLEDADVWLRVQPPRDREDLGRHESDLMREGAVTLGFLRPAGGEELLDRLAQRRITALALELLPRITRAQRMDALSAMSTVAGYKAVVIAADTLGKIFPLLMTAAGTLAPAQVLVLGAGVAGLQAIATARRLGAVVEAFDVRPAVKEQIESLGATFVEAEEAAEEEEGAREAAGGETSAGYAEQLSEREQEADRRLLARHVAKADVVITTALVPGKPAPLLITEDMVRGMRPGSTIVDLAAEAGGNCELTREGETVERHGVVIHGPIDLPARVPVHASQMYSKNLQALLGHLLVDGEIRIDLDDEITGAICVTHAGEVRYGR
ncbi:MAG: Re/Si-specific NAD(P)(+) transhydrogenase subunit alpha [Gemmatimonadetes bacterium]|nr:Re/Si-specific NAD(P)(+) transhydrogenase subunit alpha [Gemmatimonadota bacterium]